MAQQQQQQPPDLNCGLKNSLMPTSFSLHSVDLLPVMGNPKLEPNFCCLTLRNTSNGHIFNYGGNEGRSKSEIRVVHGNTEVYQCIRHVLLGPEKDQQNNAEAHASNNFNGCGSSCEGIWCLPFRIPLAETKTTIQVIINRDNVLNCRQKLFCK